MAGREFDTDPVKNEGARVGIGFPQYNPKITLWELSVAMETRSGPKPNATFPRPQ